MAMKTEFSPVKRPGQMLVSVFSRGRREFHEHDDKDSNEPEKEEIVYSPPAVSKVWRRHRLAATALLFG